MNVLLVFAHPERRSLNAALRDEAVAQLSADGHEVEVSDLYAQGWAAAVSAADFPDLADGERLRIARASGSGFAAGTLTPDVRAEHEKLLRADLVILQFPLWWMSMPAILKGWIDRVYSFGLAYGVGEHSDRRWGDRYGEGRFAGKRAMLVVTAGGWQEHYGPRGINGPIEDILFPINHGILFYPGFEVLPPWVLYRADWLDAQGFAVARASLRARMHEAAVTAPISYRRQNGGDYAMPSLALRDGVETAGATGFALHIA